MRIFHISRNYSPHDHRFLAKMADEGEQVFFLPLEENGNALEDRPLPLGVTRLRWSRSRPRPSWRDGPRMAADLKQLIRQHRPDVVQAGPVQRGAFLAALARFPNLVTMSWGYDLLIDLQRGRPWEWATRFTLRRSAAFIGDCQPVQEIAIAHGMPPERIVTFPWGADLVKYHPLPGPKHLTHLRQRKGWGPESFVLLSTRGWSPLYGVEDLVQAFVQLAPERPELRLLMLGGGPLSARIKALVHNAGLLERVHFPGQVGQDALPAYYQAADLYISTSHSDGTSISMLEALACGTPVLLRDIPGNRAWVEKPGEVGWLFSGSGLTGGIETALDMRAQLPRMGQAARALAEARGDWEKNFPHIRRAWQIALKS